MAVVLVQEADFEAVREVLEDERRQRAIRAIALRNAMDDSPEEAAALIREAAIRKFGLSDAPLRKRRRWLLEK